MKFKGAVFDLDGTLLDSMEVWKNIDIEFLSKRGLEVPKGYSDEILAMQIASIHNLAFYVWLTQEARRQIISGTFKSWKKDMVQRVTHRL